MRLRFGKFRIGAAHFFDERCDEFVEEQLVHTEFLPVANGAPDDATEYISTTFVAR